jgi:outer membrane biosynthesis protein TonB
MDMELIILVVGALAVAIAFYAIKEDKQDKEIKRLVDNAIDRDNDGWILEGTLLERKAPKKKAVAKKKPVKKAVAKKKAAPVKKKPVKKSVKKKAAAPKKKKKAVAKKKSR